MATELQVTPVEDSSALDEYRQVLAAGFGEGPKEADWVASVFAIIGLEPHSRWRHFVGTVADDPVATASTLLTDSTAGIYFVCTRPDARRRGWCRDHLRSDAPRRAHQSHVRRPRLLADGAARLRAARIPNHLLHPALRAGRVAREQASPVAEHLARGAPGIDERQLEAGRLT